MKELKIQLTDEEYEFLKGLQHELNTQTNDGNADPVYWGVEEDYLELAYEGEGEAFINTDDGYIPLEDAVKMVEDDVNASDDDTKEEWSKIDKDDADDVSWFMENVMLYDFYEVIWLKNKRRISRDTGAFLTKRACEAYIEKNAYHHDNPHAYTMTAFRNYELEKFLKIFKERICFNEDESNK